ncbi:MAG: FAD-dependent oxidoreductase [Campylobacterales bacterium]|nr:FAD-dependent oxidoreductase [Campylobacterales bacterium]
MKNTIYKYAVVGAGICGSSVVYELTRRTQEKVLLIDKNSNIAQGASGAAGAFLSPLLGKPNLFKDLVTQSLRYTTKLYKQSFANVISACGTTRIPQNQEDEKKFQEYIPYMDFPFTKDQLGYFFSVGTVVNSVGVCKMMCNSFSQIKNNLDTLFDYEVKQIEYDCEKSYWKIDDTIFVQHLIITTGHEIELLKEPYLRIRPVWGRRIDITTTTKIDHNYHKECSVSKSFPIDSHLNRVSIGATHHRVYEDILNAKADYDLLLQRANDIVKLEEIKIVKEYVGARSCSEDYFPMVGKVIDSVKTLQEFGYMRNGTHVNPTRFSRYENLYILNGVGGRGFVLAPYLAKTLVDSILLDKPIDESLTIDRLFLRDVKRKKI